MIQGIPEKIKTRMRFLEELDAQDRQDGTPRLQRLRQIPAVTGEFLALMLKLVPSGPIVEIGTSAGYSTLWLYLGSRGRGTRVMTYEYLPEKIKMARETFQQAGTTDGIDLIEGDALDHLPQLKNVAFCFLDAEKEIYQDCYELIIPRLQAGGILIADNALNHAETLQPMIDQALADERVDSMVLTIGKGLLFCRKSEVS
jgi:predicted O-methyltransferase YrrM